MYRHFTILFSFEHTLALTLSRPYTAFLKQLEEKTKVDAVYIAGGIVASALLVMYMFVGMSFICDMVGFVPPTIMSFKAIEANKASQTRHLLTYWVVFVFLSLVEMFAAIIIFWFPYYYSCKLVFLVYAFHPETKGAEKVYDLAIKPFMKKHEKTIDSTIITVHETARKISSAVDTMADTASSLATGADTNEDHQKDA